MPDPRGKTGFIAAAMKDRDLVARIHQFPNQKRANKPCAANHQKPHLHAQSMRNPRSGHGWHRTCTKRFVQNRFRGFANKIEDRVVSPWTFATGVVIVLIWAITGPVFHYSDTWQLVINTGTSVVTFLMVFLIQNTQNRDAQAMQLKLNEIIRAMSSARNTMVDLENCSDEEITAIREEFAKIREKLALRGENKQKKDLTMAG